MIEFGGRYHIDPAQVEYISTSDKDGAIIANDYPYELSVHLLSGRSLGLSYRSKEARDSERKSLINRIERATRNYEESILCKLQVLQYDISKIDKRQLRVWQQLKKLLGVELEK